MKGKWIAWKSKISCFSNTNYFDRITTVTEAIELLKKAHGRETIMLDMKEKENYYINRFFDKLEAHIVIMGGKSEIQGLRATSIETLMRKLFINCIEFEINNRRVLNRDPLLQHIDSDPQD